MPSDRPCDTRTLVSLQTGRSPRTPWRVAAECRHGSPTVIASPSRLDDGTPFPTLYWLTCPHLAEKVAELESAGGVARWAARAAAETDVARALEAADAELRLRRASESGGVDECEDVGIAGQRDLMRVKCLHAHVALALVGIADPIGEGVLAEVRPECDDDRCARMCVAKGADL